MLQDTESGRRRHLLEGWKDGREDIRPMRLVKAKRVASKTWKHAQNDATQGSSAIGRADPAET